MQNRNDYKYLKQREAEERLIVETAGSRVTKSIHSKLAEEYGRRAREASKASAAKILNILREV